MTEVHRLAQFHGAFYALKNTTLPQIQTRCQANYLIRMLVMGPRSPKAISSQSMTTMTTTSFRIFLIVPSMGM
jgi:hypothetical protein